jgi:hypothetical protein
VGDKNRFLGDKWLTGQDSLDSPVIHQSYAPLCNDAKVCKSNQIQELHLSPTFIHQCRWMGGGKRFMAEMKIKNGWIEILNTRFY